MLQISVDLFSLPIQLQNDDYDCDSLEGKFSRKLRCFQWQHVNASRILSWMEEPGGEEVQVAGHFRLI